MSRLDELDHRIGRHEGFVHPDCPVCNPDSAEKVAEEVEAVQAGGLWWDYRGAESPPFPNWGDIWRRHNEAVFVFVSDSSGGDYKGGFWVPIATIFDDQHTVESRDSLFGNARETQMEFGSGKWAGRVKILSTYQTMPSEAALSSPLGVDIPKMARQQNRAKLIVHMKREGYFPVSEITDEVSEEFVTNLTKIQSIVHAVPIPVVEPLLPDVTPPRSRP